jgi:DNA repair protein RadC
MQKLNYTCNTVAEVEILYKSKVKASERKQIKSSSEAAEILRQAYPDGQIEHRESFYTMYLSRANKVLAIHKTSEGGTTGTVADVKIIMQGALLTNAAAIILCHNHPSGQLNPSEQDKTLTEKIKKAGAIMDVSLLDHVILTEESYYSFIDNGLI